MTSESLEQNMEFEGQPSVDSSDPNERKLARRLRIKGRLEAAEKLKAIAEGTYVEPEPEKPLLDETIETCDDTLRQLYSEGKELVTNVMVASDAKEVKRRETDLEEKNDRIEKLKEDSALALEKLEEISKNWEAILDANGPLELHQQMSEQKERCLELIQQKNDLIKGFQAELKLADEKFMKERKAMFEELSLLSQRIDEQVLLMKKAYRIEIDHVEEAIDVTRTQIIEKHEKIWQNLYNQREKDEVTNMDRKFKMVESFHEEFHKLHIDHEEKYRETRIQLETDIQVLEQELEHVKALCLLNSEKLDYNYQVLKKREEENVYIKNHQKRRMNKLQDMVNTLKKKIDDKRQGVEEEFKRLTKEVKRYHKNVLETELKGDHFSRVNDEKFLSIWEMKDEEARDLISQILAADMVIHEQILGLPWSSPNASGPNKKDMHSYKTALRMVNDHKKKADHKKVVPKDGSQTALVTPEVMEGQKRLLRHILELIADQSGFLMEEKLDELLQPYTENEKTFVRLDNVFVAIDIRGEKDMETMKKLFYPYTMCLLCENQITSQLEPSLHYKAERPSSERGKSDSRQQSILQMRELEEKVSKIRVQARRDSHNSISGGSEITRETEGSVKPPPDRKSSGRESVKDQDTAGTGDSRQGPQCNITHPLVIEKHFVLKALRDFVSYYHSDRCRTVNGISELVNKERYTISRLLSKHDISAYWEKYMEMLPPRIETVWKGVFQALSRYLTILQERHDLNMRAKDLRRQNLDLKRLLSHYKGPGSRKIHMLPYIPSVPDEPIDAEELSKIAHHLTESSV